MVMEYPTTYCYNKGNVGGSIVLLIAPSLPMLFVFGGASREFRGLLPGGGGGSKSHRYTPPPEPPKS
eukprot:1195650-Prorocentrum_minimum.AAC.1